MFNDILTSRIARAVTLRRLEAVAITSTVLAFLMTVGLVGGTPLEESNAVALELVELLGWTGAGLLAIGAEAFIFAGYRRLQGSYPKTSLAGGSLVAVIGLADVAINLYGVFLVDLSGYGVAWGIFAEKTVPVVFLAALVLVRPSLPDLPRLSSRHRSALRVTGIVAITVAVALSPVLPWLGAPFTSVSPVGTAEAATQEWSATPDSEAQGVTTAHDTGAVFVWDTYQSSGDPYIAKYDRNGTVDYNATPSSGMGRFFEYGEGVILTMDGSGNAVAYDANNTSNVLWNQSILSETYIKGAAYDPVNDQFYIVKDDGASNPVVALNATDGSKVWTNSGVGTALNDDSIDVNRSTGELMVYAHTSGGTTLSRYDPSTGDRTKVSVTGDTSSSEADPLALDSEDGYAIVKEDGQAYRVDLTDNSVTQHDNVGVDEGFGASFNGKGGGFYVSYNGSTHKYNTSAMSSEASESVSAGAMMDKGSNLRLYELDTSTSTVTAYSTSFTFSSSVSGTVTDEAGDAISDATVEIEDDTGSVIETHTTDSSGSWSTSLSDGDYTAVVSASGYNDATESFSVSGSAVTVDTTLGQSSVSVKVTNQNGQPISNATVQLYYSTLPTVDDAREQIESVSDPEPYTFTDQVNRNLDIMGDNGLASKSDYYPAIYTPDNMATEPWADSADLSNPLWRDVPADEKLTVTIGDTTDGIDSNPITSGEYARQMYGHPVKSNDADDGEVVLQRMGANGEALGDELRFDLTEKVGGGYLDPSSLRYGEIPADALQPGFYTVTARVEGEDYASYVIQVGSPTAIIDEYREDTTNELTDQAKQARDHISSGDMGTKTITTGPDGKASTNISTNARVVHVQAVKAPGVDVDPKQLTMDNITQAYDDSENLPNASVYSPSTVKRVEPPAQNVQLTMYETRFPTTANTGAFVDLIEDLRNRLGNLSLSDLGLPPTNPEDVRSELESTWNSLRGLLEQYPPAKERYLELTDRESLPDSEDLSKSELRGEIAAANTALQSTDTTGEVVDDTTERAQDHITQTWEVSGIDLSEADVSVIAEYSNGTRTVVDDEYVTVDDGLARDTVTVEEFPLGENDPAQVNLKLRVAGPSSDIGSDEPVFAGGDTRITNPTFNGDVPDIESIQLNTIRPGPDDRVQLSMNPADESTFRQLSNVTVYAPDGTEVPASNITDGDTVAFDTSSQGVYQVRYTVEDTDGRQFTDTIRIKAASADEDLKPTVRVHSGPLGNIAMASDGLAGGDVSVADDGSVSVVAEAPQGEVPNEVHVHTTSLTTGPETPVTVRVVEGENRKSISEHTYVFVHGKKVSDDAITYRNGNQPVTRDGETKWGEVRANSDGTVIKTWTDQNGVVSVTTNNDPGRLDRLWFEFRVRTSGYDIPAIGVIVPGFGGLAGLGLVAHRRRRNTA